MNTTIQRSGKREVILFQTRYDATESLDQFLEVLFYRGMKYLASDLLEKGLSPEDIQEAVKRAMLVAKTAGLDLRQHFKVIYTQFRGGLMKDCKLSRLGYVMVVLNARADHALAANLQLQLLEHFFQQGEVSLM